MITDFGVSHVMSATLTAMCGTTAVSSKGTVRWTAIELLAAQDSMPATPNARSDVWAFGMLIYQVLTGKEPYKEDWRADHQIPAVISKGILPRRPVRNAWVTDEVWQIMMDCWSRQPEDRPDMGNIHERLIEAEAASLRVPA